MNESYWQPSPFSRRLCWIYEVIQTLSSRLIDSSRKDPESGQEQHSATCCGRLSQKFVNPSSLLLTTTAKGRLLRCVCCLRVVFCARPGCHVRPLLPVQNSGLFCRCWAANQLSRSPWKHFCRAFKHFCVKSVINEF